LVGVLHINLLLRALAHLLLEIWLLRCTGLRCEGKLTSLAALGSFDRRL